MLLLIFSIIYIVIFQGEEQVTAEFLAGKVPEIVYKKAIQSIPGTVRCNVHSVIDQLARLYVVARCY